MPARQEHHYLPPFHTHNDVDAAFGILRPPLQHGGRLVPLQSQALEMLEKTAREIRFERAQARLDLQKREEEANDRLFAIARGYGMGFGGPSQ